MKKILFTLFTFVFVSTITFAQDYHDLITKEVCTCLEKITPDVPTNELTTRLGLCIINAAEPYKKKIKKDLKIDMDSEKTEQMHNLGLYYGKKVAARCPEVLTSISTRIQEAETEDAKKYDDDEIIEVEAITITGKVLKIDTNGFISFIIESENKQTTTVVWITEIFSEDFNLPKEYNTLIGKNISVAYSTVNIFDSKLNIYVPYNVIKEIER